MSSTTDWLGNSSHLHCFQLRVTRAGLTCPCSPVLHKQSVPWLVFISKLSCVPYGRFLRRSPFFSSPPSRHLSSPQTVIWVSYDNPDCNPLSSYGSYVNIACLLVRIALYDHVVKAVASAILSPRGMLCSGGPNREFTGHEQRADRQANREPFSDIEGYDNEHHYHDGIYYTHNQRWGGWLILMWRS